MAVQYILADNIGTDNGLMNSRYKCCRNWLVQIALGVIIKDGAIGWKDFIQ